MASDALIALRKALGKSQSEFALELLDTAVTTVSRYETSNPPVGKVLLRLAKIADTHGLFHIRDLFRGIYIEEIIAPLDFEVVQCPPIRVVPEHGYLIMRLHEGESECVMAFVLLLRKRRNSPDVECKRMAEQALADLIETALKIC
jgi:transcriptional regulator with XRE-family HTH domain